MLGCHYNVLLDHLRFLLVVRAADNHTLTAHSSSRIPRKTIRVRPHTLNQSATNDGSSHGVQLIRPLFPAKESCVIKSCSPRITRMHGTAAAHTLVAAGVASQLLTASFPRQTAPARVYASKRGCGDSLAFVMVIVRIRFGWSAAQLYQHFRSICSKVSDVGSFTSPSILWNLLYSSMVQTIVDVSGIDHSICPTSRLAWLQNTKGSTSLILMFFCVYRYL